MKVVLIHRFQTALVPQEPAPRFVEISTRMPQKVRHGGKMSLQGVSALRLNKYKKILRRINALAPAMKVLSDGDFAEKTGQLRRQYQAGKSLEQLLPESYALVREAAGRVLQMVPYDVQVLGAIALHFGDIAEMKTGEGKTLSAAMPLYLNALTGKSCILVTTNEYLAARDGGQLSQLYAFLGMTTGIGVTTQPEQQLTAEKKRQIYACDIVYTTNAVLGFDYLIDNLSRSPKERFLRPFYYVIVDEADAVLLDSAQTPLVISGAPRVQSNLYAITDDFVSMLREEDFEVKGRTKAFLTDSGILRAQKYFAVSNLFAPENEELLRHICLALRAQKTMEREKDYLVDRGKVVLLDAASGRMLESTKLGNGLHQALEAKEHVTLSQENRQMACVTYQDLFNLFPKLTGMSGTAIQDAEELRGTYGCEVVQIPTHRPCRRKDEKPTYYTNLRAQLMAVMGELTREHETGRPVLAVTESIEVSELLSGLLLQDGIPHSVLNAHNAAREAQIIKEAGQKGAVTVATGMAGRGTDIKLGEGADALGGLCVLIVGEMENRRMELQARGRAGRQGDPGSSQVFVSLDDTVIRDHGKKSLRRYRTTDRILSSPRLISACRQAQKISEEQGRLARRSTAEYAVSLSRQRQLVYEMRDRILRKVPEDDTYYFAMEREAVDAWLEKIPGLPSVDAVARYCLDNITYRLPSSFDLWEFSTRDRIRDVVLSLAREAFARKKQEIGSKEHFALFLRRMLLRALDDAWVEQVDYLQQLRSAVAGRQYAQKNVIYEYHREAYAAFVRMEQTVKAQAMRCILLGEVIRTKAGGIQVRMP